MLTVRSASRPRRGTFRTQAPTVEGLEGRVLLAFNAYIAGLQGGASNTSQSFVLSTTGGAAKHWDINWDDNTGVEPFDAPNQTTGWTGPFTVHHTYLDPGNHVIHGIARATTNQVATAVIQESSAFGTDNNGRTGKTVQGLNDGNTVLTNIAAVVDDSNRSYVVSVDGKRMALTRFTSDGILDTTWTASGTWDLDAFTNVNNQDTPTAMIIDNDNHHIYLCGTSNGMWAIARVNINQIDPFRLAWKRAYFSGTPNALWFENTGQENRLSVAGTTPSGQIQVAKLLGIDEAGPPAINAGTLDTDFGPNGQGYVVIPNSIYGSFSGYTATATASAIFEGDDVDGLGLGEELIVSGTVTFSCSGPPASSWSDMVIVDLAEETDPTDGVPHAGDLRTAAWGLGPWGNGQGATLFNTCNSCCVAGTAHDSNYAMVPSVVNGTGFITLVGTADTGVVLTERYVSETGLRDTTYGLLKGEGPDHQSWSLGPTGTAYAAVLDASVNKVVTSGSGGTNDFLVARFNNDGMLDTSFGSLASGTTGTGYIKIDFGTTSGVTTDGAKAIAMRKWINDDGTITFDILVAGYTQDATGKYNIALVDLLDDHSFHVPT